ncbi:Transport permease protein OS=Tsukamurella paurometabola OX=2061 GN=drrB_4 PE=3 SV=1 [Tsukamurella paurometabola]|nr:daunorubicin resistance ABC transporter membrane protein [Tsukamurella paurometabola]
MIWFGILVGCLMQSIEAVNGFMFATMFPITFLSNAFVPTEGMAPWLRAVAEWNPVSSLVQSMRVLWGNDVPLRADAPWSLQNPVLATIAWSIGLTLVLAPLALRAFNQRTSD